jgi:hypothetical protein
MIKKILISFLLLIAFTQVTNAQWFPSISRRGNLYAGWGWNRASYTKSDISFKGDDYNFTLKNVEAKDRQTHFKAETYFGLKTITIPQTNFRVGYFLRDNVAIYCGVDHMKYVVQTNQTVGFDGHIDDTTYSSMVHDDQIKITDNFLLFEHTDGLNYINTEIEYYQGIWQNRWFSFNGIAGAGGGALLPKSNVTLMGYPRNDEFHLAGFGLSAKAALEFLFGSRFFIRFEYKTGYINMPDIVTRNASIADRASQQFFFAQRNGIFGLNIPLIKKEKAVPITIE